LGVTAHSWSQGGRRRAAHFSTGDIGWVNEDGYSYPVARENI